jgi:hypothetical protein
VILIIFGLGYVLFIMNPSPLNSVANVLKHKDNIVTCDQIKIQMIKNNDNGACYNVFTKNVTVRVKNIGEKIDRLMAREVNGVFFTNHVLLGENVNPGDEIVREFPPKDTINKIDIYYFITQNGELTECKMNYIRISDIGACQSSS